MSDFTANLAEAKRKCPLDATMRHFSDDAHIKASCKSPFREEATPSWGVFHAENGEMKWKDFTSGETGDQVDYIAQKLGCSTREALDTFFEMAGVQRANGNTHRPLPKRPVVPAPQPEPEPEPSTPLKPFDWDKCVEALTEEKIAGCAKWRGYSVEFVRWLKSEKLIGIYDDCPATPVSKDGVIVACQYRTADGPRYANNTPGAKSPAEPLIIGKPDAPCLLAMESQWDAFAVMEAGSYHLERGLNDWLCLAVTRSASNHAKLAGIFQDRAKSDAPGDVILVGQNDKPRLDGKPTGHDTLEAGLRKLCADTGLTLKLAMPPKHVKDVNDWWRENPDCGDVIGIIEVAKSSTKSKLTIRSVNELLGFQHKDDDNYFGDRILAEGQPATFIGPGGSGKSRLLMQWAISMIIGRPFLDVATHAPNKTWLFLQTENSNRRLQVDLKGMITGLQLGPQEIEAVNEYLLIHTIEQENDGFLDMNGKDEFAAVQGLITDLNPDFVVFDPLNTFTTGDLNSDVDMKALCTAITRATKRGNPKRVPLVLHHSLTGKAGAAKATGWDKSSYGRNSKVLQAWTRSQVNLVPRDPEDNTKLLLTCGKNNNGQYFPDIAISFDEDARIYVIDEDYDPQEFRQEVGLEKKTTRGRPSKRALPIDVAALVTEPEMMLYKLKDAVIKEFGVGKSTAYNMIDECEHYGFIKSEALGKSKAYNRTDLPKVKTP